jgi:hypothetical protein
VVGQLGWGIHAGSFYDSDASIGGSSSTWLAWMVRLTDRPISCTLTGGGPQAPSGAHEPGLGAGLLLGPAPEGGGARGGKFWFVYMCTYVYICIYIYVYMCMRVDPLVSSRSHWTTHTHLSIQSFQQMEMRRYDLAGEVLDRALQGPFFSSPF